MATHVLGGAEFGDWESADQYATMSFWTSTVTRQAGRMVLGDDLAPVGGIYEIGDSTHAGDGVTLGAIAMGGHLDVLRAQLES